MKRILNLVIISIFLLSISLGEVADAAVQKRIAGEGQVFSLSKKKTVRYGTAARYISKSVKGTGVCNNRYFGGDPAPFQRKECSISGSKNSKKKKPKKHGGSHHGSKKSSSPGTPNTSTLYTLSVSKSGTGSIVSLPSGINCGSLCSSSYTAGTLVTLTAAAGLNTTFTGWSGACSGTGNCVIAMNQNQNVTATFTQNTLTQYTLSLTIDGTGTVTSSPAGINCTSSCTANFDSGTNVTLTAVAGSGYTFSGWSGACAGTGSCSTTLSAARSMTATFTANSVSYKKPKVAALDYSNITSSTARQDQLAKFDFAIIGFWESIGITNMRNALTRMKSINPTMDIAQYTILSQWYPPEVGGDVLVRANEITNNNWWVLDANTGSKVRLDTGYNAYEVNSTLWTTPNAQGERYPQFLARYVKNTYFSQLPQLTYMFNDNTFLPSYYYQWTKTPFGDWKKMGSNQMLNDVDMNNAVADSFVAYWDKFRELNPGIKIIGNAGAGLDVAQFNNQMEGAFLECLIGKSYSPETWRPNIVGWTENLQAYRKALSITRTPHDVVYQVCSTTADNYSLMRFGLATALLDDGWFMYSEDYSAGPKWFDEYDAPLGQPTQSPPTTATSGNVWSRTYENGIVLVNPNKNAAESINLGNTYKHLSGTQDPTVNDGSNVDGVLTLPARSGLILLKR